MIKQVKDFFEAVTGGGEWDEGKITWDGDEFVATIGDSCSCLVDCLIKVGEKQETVSLESGLALQSPTPP